jgi:hypothetical protein
MKRRRITTTVAFLQAVKEKIVNGWTQGRSASDKHGHDIGLDDPRAARFCMTGALSRVKRESPLITYTTYQMAESYLQSALADAGAMSVISFNDKLGRKKSEVIAVIDNAIKKAKAAA